MAVQVLQPSLFEEFASLPLAPTVTPETRPEDGRLTIEERFRRFHEANPHVYEALERLALGMRRRGAPKWSMKAMFELLRWAYWLMTSDVSGFKLNNIYTAPYARLLMAERPELAGFFETREHREGGLDGWEVAG